MGRSRMITLIAALCLALACTNLPDPEPGKSHLVGHVYDVTHDRPVDSCLMEIVGRERWALTDCKGYFVFENVDTGFIKVVYHNDHLFHPGFGRLAKTVRLSEGAVEELLFEVRWRNVPKSAYETFYEIGEELADQEITAGNPLIYTYGLGAGSKFCLHERYGVPEIGVAGCIVSSELESLVKGHNHRIHYYWVAGRLPDPPRWWYFQTTQCIQMYLWSEGMSGRVPTILKSDSGSVLLDDQAVSIALVVQPPATFVQFSSASDEWGLPLPDLTQDSIGVLAGPDSSGVAILWLGKAEFRLVDLVEKEFIEVRDNDWLSEYLKQDTVAADTSTS